MTQLANIGLNITSWEIIILLFLLAGGFLLGVLLGRSRIFLLLLGSYISFAIMSVVPFKKFLPDLFDREEDFVIYIVIFLVLIWLIYFLLSRSVLKSSIRRKGDRSIFHIFFLSLFLMGFIVSVVFSFFPYDLKMEFSQIIRKIFDNSLARTLWLVVPIVFIGLFKRKRSIN